MIKKNKALAIVKQAKKQGIDQQVIDQKVDQQKPKHNQNLERLELANQSERCYHVRADGAPCGAPRIAEGNLCYAHTRMLAARPKKLRLPPLEDANGVQLAIMEVAKAFIDDVIDHKKASLLLYGLQIAAGNVARATFASLADDEEVVIEASELTNEGTATF